MRNEISASRDWQRGKSLRSALVSMPFFSATQPSIQLGLLKAIAEEAGFSTDCYHLNLQVAAKLQLRSYQALCSHPRQQLSEWLFSKAAFGEAVDADDQRYFEAFPEVVAWAEGIGFGAAELSKLRHEVLPRFIEDCLAMVDWGRYRAIGFSSTFQQQVASLALARRIKERYPHVAIIFGGANMVGEMGVEYLRAFPFIDCAVLGDGDHAFPALLEYLAKNLQPESLSGVALRTADGITVPKEIPPFTDLDTLPTPDYDEYFERATRLGIINNPKFTCAIPFESSRGCWWGQKHQCKFCGLNGNDIKYRVKTANKVLRDLAILSKKYSITIFHATDNICSRNHIDALFSAIVRSKLDYRFFYETKSNLTQEQIGTLYRGGVRWVQPGIENFSTHVLQLMRKGCTMLQNIRFLKWCRYYGIRVSWNLLWGFPGETSEDYRRQLEVLRLISHLEPPIGACRIILERFSPYWNERACGTLGRIRPQKSYRYAYPGYLKLDKIAYFFDGALEDTLPNDAHNETLAWIAVWQQRWSSDDRETLTYRRTSNSLLIDDRRACVRSQAYKFDGPIASIYEYCSESMRSISQVSRFLARKPESRDLDKEYIGAALEKFCNLGLMMCEKGKYLSLALPANPNF